ncbi:hypothetical protein [Nonomuraea sp. NPDC023979]|uniref:hypothetical protein n=1 Tax=Nonomuraea sp. NPDC023979 TaxID=3154796 RepID=UPI0033C30FE6
MSRRRTAWRWLLAIVAGLAVAVVAGVVVAFPSVAATTCPGCYGMKQVRPGLYLEPGLPPTRERQVAEVIDAANRRVADFYGGRAIRAIWRTNSATTLGADSTSCFPSRHENRGARPIPVRRTIVARL